MRKVLVVLILLCLTATGYYYGFYKKNLKPSLTQQQIYEKLIVNNVDNNVAMVNKYAIYGKYLNIEGQFSYNDKIDKLEIVLKNELQEIPYELKYELRDNIYYFKTGDYINRGISLENILDDNYIMLIKIITGENIVYYQLNNMTEYGNLTYYTLTKNSANSVINIKNLNYDNNKYFVLESKKTTLPKDVYDVVIDPGHGGVDSGAVNGKYEEANINLEYSLAIKEALESIGLKVKLTRNSDESIKHYGVNSRTAIPYEAKAKLMLSIHLNSTNAYVKNGGVEIYTANKIDPYFACYLADSIVNDTSTTYSPNTQNRLYKGVYLRNYTAADINNSKKTAKEEGWEPYEFSVPTTYYYFIRETGGISTSAMTDGRNPKYEANPYYNANYGVEAYLVELGYLSNSANLKIILNEKDNYVKAIKDSINFYVNGMEE